jgi:hypothetical protein
MKPLLPDELFDAGRPPGQVHGLLYNRPSNTLVAVMVRSDPPLHRLYYRRLPEMAYQPVGIRHELESQQDAHCSEQAPYLIFNEMCFREPRPTPAYLEVLLKGKDLPPEPWGADWLGIRRFNLETGEDKRVLDQEGLHPPPPYTSGWVSQILSVSADGSSAICVVGLTPGSQMTYFVYELFFADGLTRMIAELPQVFL